MYVKPQHDSWAPKRLTGSLSSLERGGQSFSFMPSSSIPGSNHGMVLIAVLHVATIPNDFGVPRTYLKSFPPLANLDGRCASASARTQITLPHTSRAAACRWSSAAWVVYVLTSMVRREMVVLPCRRMVMSRGRFEKSSRLAPGLWMLTWVGVVVDGGG